MMFTKTNLRGLLGGMALLGLAACGGTGKPTPEVENVVIEAAPTDPIVDPTKTDTLKGSPERQLAGTVGSTKIDVIYHSPAVRGRVIWGGLVPYGRVWATGAHNATRVSFGKAVALNGQSVAAGTYTIFTIPGPAEWIVIVNKNYEQHLTDSYAQADDVLRFAVKPQTLPDTLQRLTYQLAPTGPKAAEMSIGWEKIKIAFAVTEP
jgi:Protein of unknown function (DUF2911)